jgi:hypothetical protein
MRTRKEVAMARNVVHFMAAVLASTAIWGFTACNYTEGPCYRREDIEGPGSDGAGGGPIVPGWGGYGDVPPEQQSTTEPEQVDCNAEDEGDNHGDGGPPDDGSAETGLKVFCLEPEHGVVCSERCIAKGVPCGAIAAHPNLKKAGGTGKLYA